MQPENGRVTLLPKQIRRLAELSARSTGAIEVIQYGSVLKFNDGSTNLAVNADGDDIHPIHQENLW